MTTPDSPATHDAKHDAKADDVGALSDLQLMRLLDDELPDSELFDAGFAFDGELLVVEQLWADPDIASKLAQLQLIGSLVTEAVDGDARADNVVDTVMARIAAGDLPAVEGSLEQVTAAPFEATGDVVDNVVPFPSAPVPLPEVTRPAAANDNSRKIFALAAAAAAVAAGLFLWGQGPSQEMSAKADVSRRTEQPIAALAAQEPAPETQADELGGVKDATEEANAPVEIAAVDFGQLTGAVFYVPGAEAGASTAVVWVTDSGDEQ